METLAIVLAILMVGILTDRGYRYPDNHDAASLLLLAALGCGIYVAVTA